MQLQHTGVFLGLVSNSSNVTFRVNVYTPKSYETKMKIIEHHDLES